MSDDRALVASDDPGDAAQSVELSDADKAVLWLYSVYDVLKASHRELRPPPFPRPGEPSAGAGQ